MVLPEVFSGEASWDQWIFHFENVAKVNGWDDTACLHWLKVRLTGRAQTAFQRFSEEIAGDYKKAKEALQERFEPSSRKERYQAQFQTRRKRKEEEWADFAEDLRTLVDKAYPDFQDNAKEQLALNHFINQIENIQVAFSVKQRRPKNLDEVVSATLEMESYLSARTVSMTDFKSSEEEDHSKIVGAIASTNEMMGQLLTRIQKLEEKISAPSQPLQNFSFLHQYPQTARRRPGSSSHQLVCWNCGRRGHIARLCRNPKMQGNEKPPAI